MGFCTHLCQLPPLWSYCALRCSRAPQQPADEMSSLHTFKLTILCIITWTQFVLHLWLLNTEKCNKKEPARGLVLSIDYSGFSMPNAQPLRALLLHCLLNPVDVSYLIYFSLSHSVRDPPCWIKSSGLWIRRSNFFRLINCVT